MNTMIEIRGWFAVVLVGMTTVLLVERPAVAAFETLTSGNSEVLIDTDRLDTVYSWEVDGLEHLEDQTFFYRTGSMDEELRIDGNDLSEIDSGISDDDTSMFVVFEDFDELFTVRLDYALAGGPEDSNMSTLIETVAITNIQDTDPLDFTIFEFSDFDFADSADGDTVTIDLNRVVVTDDVSPMRLTITPSLPATGVAADEFFEILDLLQDSEITNFPLTSDQFGPGDAEFAFQWDFQIQAGETLTLTKSLSIVPEPASSAMMATLLGVLALARRARRGYHHVNA